MSKKLLGIVGIAATFLLGVFGYIGQQMYQGVQVLKQPAPETVEKLASQIADVNVTSLQLEQQGYYKINYGGIYVSNCRYEVLNDSFNKSATDLVKAQAITACIKRHMNTLTAQTR